MKSGRELKKVGIQAACKERIIMADYTQNMNQSNNTSAPFEHFNSDGTKKKSKGDKKKGSGL